MEPAAFVFPTQFPACQPVPVTIPILSCWESFENAALALVYAESQSITARFSLDGRAIDGQPMDGSSRGLCYQRLCKEQRMPTKAEGSCA